MPIMSMDEWNELTRKIVSQQEDQAQLSTLLTEATQTYSELLATHTKVSEDNNRLTQDNENLRKANMEVFQMMGERASERVPSGGEPVKPDDRANTIKIDDLFKEE